MKIFGMTFKKGVFIDIFRKTLWEIIVDFYGQFLDFQEIYSGFFEELSRK